MPTGQFDCVVLSQTLQAVQDVEGVLTEMVRIGRTCIVSIPNFGYHRLRNMLAETGRAPKSAGVLHYEWYNTPNIRFFTIADFEDFCREKNIRVHRRIALDTEARRGGLRAPEPERRPGDLCDQPRVRRRVSRGRSRGSQERAQPGRPNSASAPGTAASAPPATAACPSATWRTGRRPAPS